MVDCGSSGTRLKVFELEEGRLKAVKAKGKDEMDALADYVGRLGDLEKDLRTMVNASQQSVPKDLRAKTQLFMYATAGMRTLPAEDQAAVFEECRKLLKKPDVSPYRFVDARTLSGEMEAAFQYLSVNYKEDAGIFAERTTGQLEMGGASMQVAFHPEETVLDNSWVYDLLGKREIIYAKSYMGLGQNAARRKTQEMSFRDAEKALDLPPSDDFGGPVAYPCFLSGYNERVKLFAGTSQERTIEFKGTGDYEGCRNLTQRILHQEYHCDLKPCPIRGDYMTPVSGKFVGISAFKYSLLNLGLDVHSTTPGQLREAVQKFCGKDYSELHGNTKFTRYECFLGTYVYTVLHALGFSDTGMDLTFAGDHSWTLGAVLYEALARMPNSTHHSTERRLEGLPGVQSVPPMDTECYWACRRQTGGAACAAHCGP